MQKPAWLPALGTDRHDGPTRSGTGLLLNGYGATLGAWTTLVRRARLGRDRKAAALVIASYADADGTNVHCGVARLALDLEVSYSTAQRALRWMRQVGLIERVRKGNARRGLADEYRLILGPDLLEHIELPDPGVYESMRLDMRDGLRADRRGRWQRGRAVDNDAQSAVTLLTADSNDQRSHRNDR